MTAPQRRNDQILRLAQTGVQRRPRRDQMPRVDRQTLQAAKDIVNEIWLGELEADGVMEFGKHVMRGLVDLDDERLDLAQGDPVLGAVLGQIESKAIQQVKRIQSNLFTRYPQP